MSIHMSIYCNYKDTPAVNEIVNCKCKVKVLKILTYAITALLQVTGY